MTANQAFGDWLEGAQPRLAHLEAFELPDDFPFDFSAGSLNELEALSLERFDAAGDVAGDDEQGYLEGAVTYLGEALLRVGGGAWAWDDARGVPLVGADPALGLPPVSPLELLIEAVRRRTGTVLAGTLAAWRQSVELRRKQVPDWQPHKEPTPGVDQEEMAAGDAAELAAWLAERARTFPAWTARYGPDQRWDFSPESLDVLDALVRRILPSGDLEHPEDPEFQAGAEWYFGEVMRRGWQGSWHYRSGERDEYSLYEGYRWVQQSEDGENQTPLINLALVVREKPGFLREQYDSFVY